MDISVGDTFFAKYPENASHLFFIILDISDRDPQLFICAMLSSWKDGSPFCDDACIIEKGEHPFVRHKSYIAYRETMILTHDDLQNFVESGRFTMNTPASPSLIRKIRESASKSRKLPQEIRNLMMKV